MALVIQTHCISKRFNLAQNPPLAPETVYDKGMKKEIAVPVLFQVQACLGDRSFSYSFDDRFELSEWLQWEGGDFDRVLVNGAAA